MTDEVRLTANHPRKENVIAIDLIAALVTFLPVLWAIVGETKAPTEMWISGVGEFTSAKISRVGNHLKKGGEVRIMSDLNRNRHVAVIAQRFAYRHRTRKDVCVMSIRATGEGNLELMSKMNLGKAVYASRNGILHDELITVSAYKFIRKTGEVATVEPHEPSETAQQVAEVATWTSWLGVVCFYATQIPGPTAVKVPIFLLLIAIIIIRTAGLGACAPIMSILRDGWIVVRVVTDFATDINSSMDGWFWDFIASLAWPFYALCSHLWKGRKKMGAEQFEQDQSEGAPSRLGATTPSQRSNATTHTASETASSRRCEGRRERERDETECHSDGMLLRKRSDQKLTTEP